MTVVTNDRQRRAGAPAGSFASGAGGAILVGMTATLTSPTFVGRTEELARLAAAGERAAGDVPTSVLIGGEAGVGKTRLVGEVVAAARAAGVTVLHGGCVELGGEGVPFAPLVEALRAFVRDLDEPALARMVPGRSRVELARLLPELGPPAGPGAGDRAAFGGDPGPWSEQGRLFELLLGLLERLGAERPALLVVEDLHWADRSTRDLLAFLVRNLRHGRLLLVMTYRSDELHRRHPLRPFLAELDRGRRVERLELARFGPAEVAAQLAGIRGAPPPAELVERIHARSGGNAFFVEELAATAASRRRAVPEPARHPAGPDRAAGRADPAGAAGPGRGRGRRARPTAGRGGRPGRGRAAGRAARGRLGPRAAGRRGRRRLRVPARPGQGGGLRRAAAGGADPPARPVRGRPGRPRRRGRARAGRRAGLALVRRPRPGAGPPGGGRGRGGRRARLRLRRGPAPVRARPGAVGAGRPAAPAARRRPRQDRAAGPGGRGGRQRRGRRPGGGPGPRRPGRGRPGRRPAAGRPAHRAPRLPPAGRRPAGGVRGLRRRRSAWSPRSRRRSGPGFWPASGRR